MPKKSLKIVLLISPIFPLKEPEEARIPGFPIGQENKEKHGKTETMTLTTPKHVLKYPFIFPYIPLKEPKEASIPGCPIG